jgi:molybdopterin-guanine dinucleotide biosynthesis protein
MLPQITKSPIMMRPVIIGVGGAHSGAGKTTYASLLLRKFKGWGAIKYTKTALYSSVIDERGILSEDDKDTKRMLDAGAERVLWVQAPPAELGEVLPMAVERLSDLKGIVVEGNSAIEFLRPDIIIFISGSDPQRTKETGKEILKKADAVVFENGISVGAAEKARLFQKSSEDRENFLAYIAEMVENKNKMQSLLRESSSNGKILCPLARKIAEELNISYREVGKAADGLGIKIKGCELGCF